jgi:NADH:ubiquinone oxidoreductase subunit 6 (subunit J)
MLLGLEQLRASERIPWQQPLAIGLGLVLLVEAAYVIFFRSEPMSLAGAPPDGFGGPASIGETLFNQYLLPFEVVSVLLLVAMIGAIVLTHTRKRQVRVQPGQVE